MSRLHRMILSSRQISCWCSSLPMVCSGDTTVTAPLRVERSLNLFYSIIQEVYIYIYIYIHIYIYIYTKVF